MTCCGSRARAFGSRYARVQLLLSYTFRNDVWVRQEGGGWRDVVLRRRPCDEVLRVFRDFCRRWNVSVRIFRNSVLGETKLETYLQVLHGWQASTSSIAYEQFAHISPSKRSRFHILTKRMRFLIATWKLSFPYIWYYFITASFF